jgi:membrane-bound lytic murein transglycosylase F
MIPLPKQCLFFIWLLFLLFSACKEREDEQQKKEQKGLTYDLLEIKSRGSLRALVDNSSTSYFIYKGSPMGFEYELLSRYAKAIKVDLEIIPIKNLDNMIDSLENFQGDIIAANLTITKERTDRVAFTSPLISSKQVLVQRRPSFQEKKQGHEIVASPSDLIGKKVYVRKHSSFFRRLKNLSEEVGGEIQLKEVAGNVTVEQLIRRVSEGEIDYTVADEHVAKINRSYYKNIHIGTALSLEQKMAWAVRKESPDLLISINEWLRHFKKTTDFRVIYLKYFGNTMLYKSRLGSKLYAANSGTLSPYDMMIKEESGELGWDWKLLVSLIYQESQFDAEAVSWAGAQGLMQLMPSTAEEYGVDSTSDVRSNIRAGIKYLHWLDEQFLEKVPDQEERIKFVLAAYNVGLGHVFDAIRLAGKHGKNPQRWEQNVALMLLNKEKPEFYKDEEAFYGYCRGSEPYTYVKQIMKRYEHYKNVMEKREELS